MDNNIHLKQQQLKWKRIEVRNISQEQHEHTTNTPESTGLVVVRLCLNVVNAMSLSWRTIIYYHLPEYHYYTLDAIQVQHLY